jgi:hypothetical protein
MKGGLKMIKRLTVEIEKELHDKAKAQSYKEGRTIKSVIVLLIEKWLKGEVK